MSAQTRPPDLPMRIAHGQLRFIVLACCWLIGLSLVTQIFVWSIITFTDIRSTIPQASSPDVPLVVIADEPTEPSIFSPAEAARMQNEAATGRSTTKAFSLSQYDRFLSAATSAARTLGTLGVLTLCPLVAIGLLLSAICGAYRLDLGISSFSWSIVLALLILPIGSWIGLPWSEGALSTYSAMLREVEAAKYAVAGIGFDLQFYSRFLLLPSLCLLGFILLGIRFSGSVQGLLVVKESHKLDPALEQEIANMKATSLHSSGRRFTGALKRMVNKNAESAEEKPITKEPSQMPTATKVSTGDTPKRLI
ncbi:MAG: hypothetical protein IH984_15650 [Planctomycetes bacterium]|nr:hypothetical protein [Planctomycetota bacterium]